MKKLNWVFILLIMFFIAAAPALSQECNIYFLHSKTCPHCIKEKVFLEEMQEKYSALDIQYIEVSENNELFKQLCEKYDTIAAGVPRTIINGMVFVGFTEEDGELEYLQGYKAYNGYKNQIEKAIIEHLETVHNISVNETCIEEQAEIEDNPFLFIPLIFIIAFIVFYFVFRKKIEKQYMLGILFAIILLILFYLAQHIPPTKIVSFAKAFSFPVFTVIIALLDGFNPCAFAILAILLSLLVYSKSKKKMALIGFIFITTSAVMYFLFIIILLTLRAELLGGHKDIIRIVVGLIALIVGSINIKDFFFFKKGISLTISEEKMTGIVAKMRKIVNEVKDAQTPRALFLAILGTIMLASLVNLVELGCTLILPIQYIEVLITNFGTHVSFAHYMYTAVYCIVYVVPLFAILGSFLYSFKSERMTEAKGRLLKLIGGLVMIGLGIILLFKPELMVFG